MSISMNSANSVYFFDVIFDFVFGIVRNKIGLRFNGNEILANGFNDLIGSRLLVFFSCFVIPKFLFLPSALLEGHF